ncbi:hypothetical protein HMPREF1314_1251 [Bifidobacterium longum subsp. longum 35B]|nr:hypothetical protein HMPREF1314_1251 [Bifidobacterium longum subsp. longum 35B]
MFRRQSYSALIDDWLIDDWLIDDWLIDDWLIDDWLIDDWLIDDWLIVARHRETDAGPQIIIAFD